MVQKTKKKIITVSMSKYGRRQKISLLLLVGIISFGFLFVAWYVGNKDSRMTSKAQSWTSLYAPSIHEDGGYYKLKRVSVCVNKTKDGTVSSAQINFNRGTIKVRPVIYVKIPTPSGMFSEFAYNNWGDAQNITLSHKIDKKVAPDKRYKLIYGARSENGRDGFLPLPSKTVDLTKVKARC